MHICMHAYALRDEEDVVDMVFGTPPYRKGGLLILGAFGGTEDPFWTFLRSSASRYMHAAYLSCGNRDTMTKTKINIKKLKNFAFTELPKDWPLKEIARALNDWT